jgi:hypothetical protein
MPAQLPSRKAWRIMGFVRDSTQGGKDRHTLVSVNLIVLTYVDEQDFITFDDEFNYDAVADIDRDGRQIAHTSLKAMEPQRWMIRVEFKQFQGLSVLAMNLRVFFQKLPGSPEITFGINQLIGHQRPVSCDHQRFP